MLKLNCSVKVKARFSLCLMKHHTMKNIRRCGGIAPNLGNCALHEVNDPLPVMGDRTTHGVVICKDTFSNLRLTNKPNSERNLNKDETALAYLRFCLLEYYFMEPDDYLDPP